VGCVYWEMKYICQCKVGPRIRLDTQKPWPVLSSWESNELPPPTDIALDCDLNCEGRQDRNFVDKVGLSAWAQTGAWSAELL
jgi:hypothetical protein